MRHALYFTPRQAHPLTRAAAGWLGRDAFADRAPEAGPLGGLSRDELDANSANARRYAFHATLKAPFALADGRQEAELVAALDAFAAARTPFSQALKPALHEGFFALLPDGPSGRLDALAADAVRAFEPFRAPLSEADIARRNPDRLSAGERDNLMRWGYPYVFEAFRFHMTLTDRIAEADRPRFARAVDAVFEPLTRDPIDIESIALFVEPEAGAPFTVKSWHRLGASA